MNVDIPTRLPILCVTDGVLLPSATIRVHVRSKTNMSMIEANVLNNLHPRGTIILMGYRMPDDEDASGATNKTRIHKIATAALVNQIITWNWPSSYYTAQLTGLCRVRIDRIVDDQRLYPIAEITRLDRLSNGSIEENLPTASLINEFRADVEKLVELRRSATSSSSFSTDLLKKSLQEGASIDVICDLAASILPTLSYRQQLNIIDAIHISERLSMVHELIKDELKTIENDESNDDSESSSSPHHHLIFNGSHGRDIFRKSRSGRGESTDKLLVKLKNAKLPATVRDDIMKEYEKLKSMHTTSPDHSSLLNYLELIADLPWSITTVDRRDITQSKKDLDADHYGLKDVKKRVLEFLAIRQLRQNLKGPILCLVGPPGVGKTSIAKSIAQTLGRTVSLGGISDQSEIRGHRRTYVSSMPGRIIQGLKTAKTRNPVFLLDEVDKITSGGLHGDPSSALLEVLDPEQNHTFVDHYLNVPFDLSQVMFIATANNSKSIPRALLDRMELVEIAGYSSEEKLQIALKHVIPKQLNDYGIALTDVCFPDATVAAMIEKYTREAGVRQLQRVIAAVCRSLALDIAESKSTTTTGDTTDSMLPTNTITPISVDEHRLDEILGMAKYVVSPADRLDQPGIAAGMAWSPVGGEILYVETSMAADGGSGQGKLRLTGQLGDVLKESAAVAMSWIRSHARQLGIKSSLLIDYDIHIHVPAGAIAKDGPSAGITLLVALISLFTNRKVRPDTVMTGEITLRGALLPVGGISEKIMCAHRSGFKRAILPEANRRNVTQIESGAKDEMEFVYASHMEDAICAAFADGFTEINCNTSKI